MNRMRPEKLTDEPEKTVYLFRKVPGMDEQILDALHGLTPIREIRLLPEEILRLWDGRVPERPVCRMRW